MPDDIFLIGGFSFGFESRVCQLSTNQKPSIEKKINNIIKKLLNNNNKRKNCYQSISHHRVCILECTFLVVVD